MYLDSVAQYIFNINNFVMVKNNIVFGGKAIIHA